MAKSTQDMLQEATDTFAEQLTSIVEAAVTEALLKATSGLQLKSVKTTKARPSKTTAPVKTSKGKGRRKKGAKRTKDELATLKNNLLDQIRKDAGQGIEVISKAMRVPTRELKGPMMKLIAEKAVKTKGQKRATKYFAKG